MWYGWPVDKAVAGAFVTFFIVVGLITLQFGVDRRAFQRTILRLPKSWQRRLLSNNRPPSQER